MTQQKVFIQSIAACFMLMSIGLVHAQTAAVPATSTVAEAKSEVKKVEKSEKKMHRVHKHHKGMKGHPDKLETKAVHTSAS